MRDFFARISLLLLLSVFFAGPAFAQDPKEPKPEKQPRQNLPDSLGNRPDSLAVNDSLPALRKPGKSEKDTTKVKRDSIDYGPETTFYFLWEDLYDNSAGMQRIDTTIDRRHRYNYLQNPDDSRQDLGTLGSPIRDIYYQGPAQIGTRLGLTTMDPYVSDAEQIMWFNTMSPYTDIAYVEGGKGRTKVDITFSRNAAPDLNFTLYYHRIEAEKMFARANKRNNNFAVEETMGFSAVWFSRNHRYKLTADLRHYEQSIINNGGYSVHDTLKTLDYLLDPENEAQLVYRLDDGSSGGFGFSVPEVTTLQDQNRLFLYHQYALFDSASFQVFHKFSWSERRNRYRHESFSNTSGLYTSFHFDSLKQANPAHNIVFKQLDNTLGIKGILPGNIFWRGALRYRQYDMSQSYAFETGDSLQTDDYPDELLGEGTLDWRPAADLGLRLDASAIPGADYRLKAVFRSKYGRLAAEIMSYKPSATELKFNGNFMRYDSSGVFVFTDSRRLSAETEINLPYYELKIKPWAEYTSVENFIYRDSLGLPHQAGQGLSFVKIGLRLSARYRKFVARMNFQLNQSDAGAILPLPDAQFSGSFFYENFMFSGAMFGQLGLDVHYKTAYRAYGYVPYAREFGQQSRFEVEGFPVVDFFFNFRVKKALFFLKVNNLMQGLAGDGNFTTPLYIAQPRSFQIGANLRFFD